MGGIKYRRTMAFVFMLATLGSLGLLAQQPVLQVSPTSLSFEGQVGGPIPDPQYLTIANTGSGIMEWRASADAEWIILGGTRGKLSSGRAVQLLVWVKLERLGAGEYQGTITISSPNAQGSPVQVAVTLILKPSLAITKLDFPEQIPSDGSKVIGTVEFTDDGDINKVTFEVVEAVSFTPFEFNPKEAPSYKFDVEKNSGSFKFYIVCYIEQSVKLKVTLFDEAGNKSDPWEFSFKCSG